MIAEVAALVAAEPRWAPKHLFITPRRELVISLAPQVPASPFGATCARAGVDSPDLAALWRVTLTDVGHTRYTQPATCRARQARRYLDPQFPPRLRLATGRATAPSCFRLLAASRIPRCSGVGPLRWARYPDEGRPPLPAPDEVQRANVGGHAECCAGDRFPLEGLTITHGLPRVLCGSCVVIDPRRDCPRPWPGGRRPPRLPAGRWLSPLDPVSAPSGRPPTNPEGTLTMLTPRLACDPWRDAKGTPIPPQCRVEQIAVAEGQGALLTGCTSKARSSAGAPTCYASASTTTIS